MPYRPSSVTIFTVTKLRPGQVTITLASVIFIRPSLTVCSLDLAALTLQGPQIARFQVAGINDNFLQGRTRIYPVETQTVQARRVNGVGAGGGADVVQHRSLPRLIAQVFKEVDGLGRLALKANTIANAAAGNKVQAGGKVTVDGELARAEKVHVVLHIGGLRQVGGAVIGNRIGTDGGLSPAVVGDDVKPVAAFLVLPIKVARFDAHVTVGFDKPFGAAQ